MPLPNYRHGGRPRRVAYGDHAVTAVGDGITPIHTPIYTGTSVSAAVVSAVLNGESGIGECRVDAIHERRLAVDLACRLRCVNERKARRKCLRRLHRAMTKRGIGLRL